MTPEQTRPLVAFLRARLAEDYAVAHHHFAERSSPQDHRLTVRDEGGVTMWTTRARRQVTGHTTIVDLWEKRARQLDRNQQALAHLEEAIARGEDVASRPTAIRREEDYLRCVLMDLATALQALALVYASHPDYRQEWTP